MQDDAVLLLMSSVFIQVTGRRCKWEQEAERPKGTKITKATVATGGERVMCRGSKGQDDTALIAMSRVLMQVTARLEQAEASGQERVEDWPVSGPPPCREEPGGHGREREAVSTDGAEQEREERSVWLVEGGGSQGRA